MPRQSITFTPPNDEWLKTQVDNEEYASKSEVINDLIRKARQQQSEVEALRAALIAGEQSGMSDRTPAEIRQAVIERMQSNGTL